MGCCGEIVTSGRSKSNAPRNMKKAKKPAKDYYSDPKFQAFLMCGAQGDDSNPWWCGLDHRWRCSPFLMLESGAEAMALDMKNSSSWTKISMATSVSRTSVSLWRHTNREGHMGTLTQAVLRLIFSMTYWKTIGKKWTLNAGASWLTSNFDSFLRMKWKL